MFPCKDCPDRDLTCHDRCQRFLEAKEKRSKDKARMQGMYDAISILVEGAEKAKQRKRCK